LEVYLSNVWHNQPLISWTRLIAVTFVTTARLLSADDQPASSDGYKTVPVTVGGKVVPIRVKDAGDPFKNVSSSDSTGKYDPQRIFSTTSLLADKTFSFPSDSIAKSNSDFNNRDQNTFITKAYTEDTSAPYPPNLNTKVSFPAAAGYSRNAAGFDKSFASSSTDLGQNRTAAFASSATSADQNRTAILGGPEKPEVFASDPMANKQYLGPGAQHVPDGIVIKDNIVLSRMSGLPNRPLTIDEVRNLINHDVKPNTDVKPDEPSKPLNDPNYKPEPLRDMPPPTSDDDANDPVPPPGTMAAPQSPAPENSEPLPQQ
jgi:hypothetical protein